jgi:hypothetical protein
MGAIAKRDVALGPAKFNRLPTTVRWPAEEIGKYSVNQRRIPRIAAITKIFI